jgi:glutathione synthase/RimK-type ligase-like ATP-grasp enzyme
MKIAFATCSAMPAGSVDDHAAAALLGAEFRVWDDPSVDWSAFDRVLLRSVWDYTRRLTEFLAWCEAVGPQRLRNAPGLVAFNADKRYLGELAAPTVPTTFLAPGEALPASEGEVVIKPNVSAGARNTGRFEPGEVAAARALVERIQASGKVALVQPYLASVAEQGETALVFLGGELSHVLRKRPVLRDRGIAPVAPGELEVAAAMLEDDLVEASNATPAQEALAHQVIAEISSRFGTPLYARVDLVASDDGAPILLELEAIEPALYLSTAPGSAELLAAAVLAS